MKFTRVSDPKKENGEMFTRYIHEVMREHERSNHQGMFEI